MAATVTVTAVPAVQLLCLVIVQLSCTKHQGDACIINVLFLFNDYIVKVPLFGI